MSPAALLGWTNVVTILLSAGLATVSQVRGWFSPTVLTDEQLNAILDGVLTDALRREAQAKAAAGQ
jgi:hypothetical protein